MTLSSSKALFDYDFKPMEEELGIDCFTKIENYQAIGKPELMYNKNVSEKVRDLSEKLESAKDEEEFFDHVTQFYKDYGVGMFGLNKAFRISDNRWHGLNSMQLIIWIRLCLMTWLDMKFRKRSLLIIQKLSYREERRTTAFLFGDSGTGKSTSIKAIVNEYYDQGLRMIEIYKHQFKDLV